MRKTLVALKIPFIAGFFFLFGVATTIVAMATLDNYRESSAAAARAASQADIDATLRSTCAALAENGGRAWVCDPR